MVPNLSVALAVLAFVVLWIGASIVMARGNWSALAQSYRFTGQIPGGRWKAQGITHIGGESYENGLTVGTDAGGLYLAMRWVFRAGHPPLFIPWSDISTAVHEGFLCNSMVFHFRLVPSVPLRVSESLGRRIAAAGRTPVADAPGSP